MRRQGSCGAKALKQGPAPSALFLNCNMPKGRGFKLKRMTLTFAEASQRVDAFISQFEEGYFPPLLMLARLTEETGEVARVISHQNGKKPKAGEAVGDLEMELADLLFVMICMANERGLSLERGFERMMHKIDKRDARRWTKKEP